MNKTLKVIFTYFSILLKIGAMIATFYLIRYLGLKGTFGFILGTALTGYLFMSKNPLLLMIMRLTDEKDQYYINEIKKPKKKNSKS